MAKEKRSAADLDAELAALEAELAALEGKAQKAPKAKKERKSEAAPAAAPVAEAERAPPPTADLAAAPEKKSRFAFPTFGKKASPAVAPAPASELRVAPETAPPTKTAPVEPMPAPASHAANYDVSVWRQDEGSWVRMVPETRVPVIRRVLDEEGNVVREEPAELREVEDVSSVKAERGLGRLLRRK